MLYFKYFSIQLRSAMQYKISFWMATLGQFLISFTAFLAVYFLFQRFHTVEGFSYEQVLLCFAVIWLSFALSECFARGFDAFPSIIGNGMFDRILLRPRSPILQVLGSKMDFTRLGKLVQAVILFCIAVPGSGVAWTGRNIAVLALMVLGGVALFSGLFLIYASLCFFTLEGLEFMNVFTDGGREFGGYPLSIYGPEVLKFYTFVVPMALVQYYPLLFLLGRAENPLWGLAPLGAFLFLVPCWLLWRFGVRHYRSTGS